MEGTIAGGVALLSLILSLALALRCQQLGFRLRDVERALQGMGVKTLAPPAFGEHVVPNALEGLRVALAIKQDHEHPVFATLLKDLLLKEDVADVALLSPSEAAQLRAEWKGQDVLIEGEITCNGYAEVYYKADFTCDTADKPICTLIEKPPHGDRPGNLAIELIARLKSELSKVVDRDERRSAIRELRG